MRASSFVPLLLAAALLLAGCFGSTPSTTSSDGSAPSSSPPPTSAPPPTPGVVAPAPVVAPAAPIRFILTGDTGTGSEEQYQVARTIESVCKARGCDFMAILGDLIYEIGVSSPNDPQFESKFELPYANLTFPIYTVLGNHDNSFDPVTPNTGVDLGIGHWYEGGKHMIEYNYRTDRLSDKWQLPARYYSFRVGDAEFFALDSNTMMFLNVPFGSANPQAIQDALAQNAWFDEAVAASSAPWKFTLAHHPYVSNGEHGNAGDYDRYPLPVPGARGDGVQMFFDDHVCPSGEIDLHFSGHDHDLQWLKPVESCGATEFIVSGAGAKNRELVDDPAEDAYFGQGGLNGFFWVEVRGDTFTATVFDAEGNTLFERALTKAD